MHSACTPKARDHARADAYPGRRRRLPRQGRAASDRSGLRGLQGQRQFPDNRARHGLPTIQGAILLFDASTGSPVALLDSIEITFKRTGAATAVAARYLARPDSQVATISAAARRAASSWPRCATGSTSAGCFWSTAMPRRRKALPPRSREGLDVDVPAKPRKAARASDVIVTCTSAHAPFLGPADVRPGTFIAAIGADNPDKSEIDPVLMARARVVTDLTEQCCHMGDLNHAIAPARCKSRTCMRSSANWSLGKDGRTQAHEITLFDGTGVGIQDVAASARAYELACDRMPAAASASGESSACKSQGEKS